MQNNNNNPKDGNNTENNNSNSTLDNETMDKLIPTLFNQMNTTMLLQQNSNNRFSIPDGIFNSNHVTNFDNTNKITGLGPIINHPQKRRTTLLSSISNNNTNKIKSVNAKIAALIKESEQLDSIIPVINTLTHDILQKKTSNDITKLHGSTTQSLLLLGKYNKIFKESEKLIELSNNYNVLYNMLGTHTSASPDVNNNTNNSKTVIDKVILNVLSTKTKKLDDLNKKLIDLQKKKTATGNNHSNNNDSKNPLTRNKVLKPSLITKKNIKNTKSQIMNKRRLFDR
ncbi:Duo1p SCDLUD_000985 [Saccharomycodes ludwigii]|uniref:Duo1p n=1 Tax=Saccharomycodes ludwigii TaxID=36035 RepID=UPI001E84D25B|nr:hypothetical protein SCDLUD_000985 [Saccharomycodes ludwigii]KAH3903356.1 hypothetical protein SCDLUD_000985 [Saccharomycodes ludwigii]